MIRFPLEIEDTNFMEAKIKHLEFIQNTINRMAGNSFLLKGWSITIVGGLLAFSLKEMSVDYVLVSLAVLFFFWILDSYFLTLERSYIRLYDHVRQKSENDVDFSMDTKNIENKSNWWDCSFSKTIKLFYGGLALVHLFIILMM